MPYVAYAGFSSVGTIAGLSRPGLRLVANDTAFEAPMMTRSKKNQEMVNGLKPASENE